VVAPLFGDDLVGGDGQKLLTLYGLTLLAATVDTTSLSLMRLLGRFRFILGYTVVRETIRVSLLGLVLVVFGSLTGVLGALVVVESVMGAIAVVAAARAVRANFGARLTDRSHFATRDVRRGMLAMVFHTNFVAYAKILVSQAPAVLLGTVKGPAEAGAFKIGTSVATALGRLSDPAWSAVMPRLAKLWNAGRVDEIRRLTRQASLIALAATGAVAVVAIVLREPILRVVGGEEATVAGTVLVFAVLAKVVNGTLFWNTSVLYAAKQARTASRMYLSGAAVFAPALYFFSREWGAEGAAAAVLVWAVQTNLSLGVAAVRTMRAGSSERPAELAVPVP
jgi:O-antigen/teichoic acid export membrane protein